MKKTYLLDTSIVSEFVKEIPDEQVINFYNARKDLCAISSVTWQEIIRGVSGMPEGKRKNTLKSFVNDLDLNMEVITFDKFSAQICGEIQAAAEKNGKKVPYYDSQIAATAVSNGMVLVTHNISDFEQFKGKSFLHLEDWFTAQIKGNADDRATHKIVGELRLRHHLNAALKMEADTLVSLSKKNIEDLVTVLRGLSF